jgi:hypothetical protein
MNNQALTNRDLFQRKVIKLVSKKHRLVIAIYQLIGGKYGKSSKVSTFGKRAGVFGFGE